MVLCAALPFSGLAKGYSSGGTAYSSHPVPLIVQVYSSSRSSGQFDAAVPAAAAASPSVQPGQEYSSGSTWNDSKPKGNLSELYSDPGRPLGPTPGEIIGPPRLTAKG